MCPYKQSLSLQLLLTLSVLFNTTTAASILKRDPSTLINIRHPVPEPEPVLIPEVKQPGRLTTSGYGVVAVPISPTGERVHVDINSSPSNQNQETNGGGSEPDSEYIELVKVGDTTFQIIGTELTITDDRGDSSQPGNAVSNGGSNSNQEGGLSDQKLTPGQLAAMEFAKTAQAIAADKDRVQGGTARLGGDEMGLGHEQDHEQPLGIGRRRRQIQR